jgi:hypothetical protein
LVYEGGCRNGIGPCRVDRGARQHRVSGSTVTSRSGVGSSFVFGVLSFTFVLDVISVSVAFSLVVYDLNTAVGKYNIVASGGYFTIAALSVRVTIVAAVVIIKAYD